MSLDADSAPRLLVREKKRLYTVPSLGRRCGVIASCALMANSWLNASDFSGMKLRYSKSVVRLHYPNT